MASPFPFSTDTAQAVLQRRADLREMGTPQLNPVYQRSYAALVAQGAEPAPVNDLSDEARPVELRRADGESSQVGR